MFMQRLKRKEAGSHVFPLHALPVPCGAIPLKQGVQFRIISRHACRVWLMLFNHPDAAHPDEEFELHPERDRYGDVWHIFVKRAHPGQFYAYRMEGDTDSHEGRFYDADQWLLDPCARAVTGGRHWGDTQGLQAGEVPRNGPHFPKGVIVEDDFDWSSDVTPALPLRDLILYETHVRGFTAHPSAGVKHPGTFRGLIDKIPYLRELGINAIELLPIHEFNEMEYYQANDPRRELRNFWGYSTRNFFSPQGRYAAAGVTGGQVREFQELVLAMHQAGIEVVLDVVFNHTTEGGRGGPTCSFRGIDNDIYYMMEDDHLHYRNYTGCGNTVNCNHPMVRRFIVDCLRYWVETMHVDGFRFDLASIFCRGQNGDVLDRPPIVEEIAEDPVLRHTKLIAEAWDAAGLYQVGSFPSPHWSEWNGRYRDDIRHFWNSDHALLPALARRLRGSDDLYEADGQTPLKSINFITAHDGFTLHDLVSYNHKHNEANGEENRDGDNHNHSNHYGHEGPSDDPKITSLRLRQMKNMIATLFLSQGVPMLLAGDEMARTQQGSNNAYCQDNETSWVDWTRLEAHADLHAFFRQAIQMRLTFAALRTGRFLSAGEDPGKHPEMQWMGFDGKAPDWRHGRGLACLLQPRESESIHEAEPDSLFFAINGRKEPRDLLVPRAPGQPWRIVLSTEERPPVWKTFQQKIPMDARSVLVLASTPKPRP